MRVAPEPWWVRLCGLPALALEAARWAARTRAGRARRYLRWRDSTAFGTADGLTAREKRRAVLEYLHWAGRMRRLR